MKIVAQKQHFSLKEIASLKTLSICIVFLSVFSFLPLQAQDGDPCLEVDHTLTSSKVDVACYGEATGTAVVTSPECSCVFSGCLFEWSNGNMFHEAQDLEAGTYYVTVTHPNGCSRIDSVTIEQPEFFVEEVTIQDASCFGESDGRIIIEPSTTAGPLNYAWSNGVEQSNVNGVLELNNVNSGEYEVVVSNLIGCEFTQTIFIDEPASASLSAFVTDACSGNNNGEALVLVSGGTPPFDYLWSDANSTTASQVTGLGSGNYEVTVTDGAGCEYVQSGIQIGLDAPPVTASANVALACAGDEVMLVASGGASYQWTPANLVSDPNAANPMAMVYEPTVFEVLVETAEGCSNTAQVTVDVLNSPNPTVNVWNDVLNVGESTQMIAIDAQGATFSWSPATGLNNPNINAPVASPTETTTYTLTATNAQGCSTNVEVTITVMNAVGIDDNALNDASWIGVFPNPSTGIFQTAFNLQQISAVTLRVYTATGQIVQRQQLNNQVGQFNQAIDLSEATKGLYFLEVIVDEERYIKKLLLN
ncbi:MAG: T9SS type A sorting domain-containing protein [Chitinophagales bacterium]